MKKRQKPTEEAKIDHIVEYIIVIHCVLIRVSQHGVRSYWGDCISFPTDQGQSISKTFCIYKSNKKCLSICFFLLKNNIDLVKNWEKPHKK